MESIQAVDKISLQNHQALSFLANLDALRNGWAMATSGVQFPLNFELIPSGALIMLLAMRPG